MKKNNQSGRSMIEMLGVLAIIGVLSVGGIAGYSKAMMKYRINKTIDQITQISQNVRALYARQRQKRYRNLYEGILYKANLAPKEMFGSGNIMTNAWGQRFMVGSEGDDQESFGIATLVPEEACIELATQDWGSRDTTGLIGVIVREYDLSGPKPDLSTGTIGNNYAVAVPGGSKVSVPMPVDIAVNACSLSSGDYFPGYKEIGWVFQ